MKISDFKVLSGKTNVLATFKAEIGGITVCGCSILRWDDGKMIVLPPSCRVHGSDQKAVWFSNLAVKAEFDERALAVYRAMTGEVTGPVIDVAAKRPVEIAVPAVDDDGMAAVRRVVRADVAEALATAGL